MNMGLNCKWYKMLQKIGFWNGFNGFVFMFFKLHGVK